MSLDDMGFSDRVNFASSGIVVIVCVPTFTHLESSLRVGALTRILKWAVCDAFACFFLFDALKVWDVRKKMCIQTYKGHTKGICVLRFSPDGAFCALNLFNL